MPGTFWTDREVQFLTQQLAQALAPSEISMPGRSSVAIGHKARHLGLVGDGVARQPWTSQELVTLEKLHQRGLNTATIVVDNFLPGRSRDAIKKQLSRTGLVDKERSRRVRQARRLSAETLSQFHAFLRLRWQTCTPEQLAKVWNEDFPSWPVTRYRVIYHLTQLRIKLPWREVIALPYSKAKQGRVSPRRQEASRRRWRRYWEHREQQLRALAKEKTGKQRRCRDCGRMWPAGKPFFTIREKITKRAGRRAYVGRICAMCRAARRRKKV